MSGDWISLQLQTSSSSSWLSFWGRLKSCDEFHKEKEMKMLLWLKWCLPDSVGSNPAWSFIQQASFLQKKAKLTKAATFSIAQVFLRVAEHRGKIHASQPASLDFTGFHWVAINRTHLDYSKWHYRFGTMSKAISTKKYFWNGKGGRVALLP